jgi:hypothetical protein
MCDHAVRGERAVGLQDIVEIKELTTGSDPSQMEEVNLLLRRGWTLLDIKAAAQGAGTERDPYQNITRYVLGREGTPVVRRGLMLKGV